MIDMEPDAPETAALRQLADMHRRAVAAEAEVEALRRRVAEAEADCATYPATPEQANAHIRALEAPPVVPSGYEVRKDKHDGTWGLAVVLSPVYPRSEKLRAQSMRAGAWAIEHDARPPHAADVKGGG